jgi:hypothetical protein
MLARYEIHINSSNLSVVGVFQLEHTGPGDSSQELTGLLHGNSPEFQIRKKPSITGFESRSRTSGRLISGMGSEGKPGIIWAWVSIGQLTV